MNESLAARAVASMPPTAAPPSFDGHGWLVVINIAGMTTMFLVALMVIIMLCSDGWRGRVQDGSAGLSPARAWRRIGLLYAAGVLIRCGAEAAALWTWNPHDPQGTSTFLLLKRILDPLALMCAAGGLGLFVMTLPGMIEQLRKEPLVVRLWQQRNVLQRITGLALLSLIASIGLVATR